MRIFVRFRLVIMVITLGLHGASGLVNKARASEAYGAASSNIDKYLDRLVFAYPNAIARQDGKFLVMKNGVKFPISDNETNKTFDELLAKPDIDDMFYVSYPIGAKPAQPPPNFDPGRVRFEPLFTAMYGDCKKNEV